MGQLSAAAERKWRRKRISPVIQLVDVEGKGDVLPSSDQLGTEDALDSPCKARADPEANGEAGADLSVGINIRRAAGSWSPIGPLR